MGLFAPVISQRDEHFANSIDEHESGRRSANNAGVDRLETAAISYQVRGE
jgi:hypothetical protein